MKYTVFASKSGRELSISIISIGIETILHVDLDVYDEDNIKFKKGIIIIGNGDPRELTREELDGIKITNEHQNELVGWYDCKF